MFLSLFLVSVLFSSLLLVPLIFPSLSLALSVVLSSVIIIAKSPSPLRVGAFTLLSRL